MNRLETRLRAARDGGRKILVPFFTGCWPDPATFVRLLLTAEAEGADAVEIGLPFSDPSADGPVIQRTSHEALRAGASVRGVLTALAEARARGLSVPVVLMTYANPVLAFGPETFAREAAAAGADGLLLVDVPAEEADEFVPAAVAAGLDTIFLAAPTTPESRIPRVLEKGRGFVYCVSVTGVTGEKKPLAEAVALLVDRVRRHSDLPVLVGFGVEGPEAARSLAAVSDGVIVGSALLRRIGALSAEAAVEAARDFLRGLRTALGA
ncbi:MAG: tryptophan synthase subunit alpha [Deltaproteobacteria bacterium]|nr:tryptophan synthase subunit alpha [Deltaproteobacteria bacterium]